MAKIHLPDHVYEGMLHVDFRAVHKETYYVYGKTMPEFSTGVVEVWGSVHTDSVVRTKSYRPVGVLEYISVAERFPDGSDFSADGFNVEYIGHVFTPYSDRYERNHPLEFTVSYEIPY